MNDKPTGTGTAKTLATAVAAAAVLLAGMGLGAALGTPSGAVAQEESQTEATTVIDRIRQALEGLVGEGVITSEQADTVAETLAEQFPKPGFHFGGPGPLEVAAEAIGIDRDDLVSQLQEGATIAEVATANGVQAQAVIDALVDDWNARIDAAVDAGRLSEEQAADLRAGAAERAEALVNGELEVRFGGFWHRHRGWFGVPDTDETQTEETSA